MRFALVLLLATCASAQLMTLPHRRIMTPTGPTFPNAFCAVLGSASGSTTTAIDTTGAKMVIGIIAGFSSSGPFTYSDNKANGNATKLTAHNSNTGDSFSQIFYWLNPTVGAGHTFTVTGGGSIFASICIIPVAGTGITGAFDAGTDVGFHGTTSCQPGSITPTSGHVVIQGASTSGTAGTSTITSPYTLVGSTSWASGSDFGIGGARWVADGTATNPTWTTPANSSCSAASFH